jgi:DnaJ-class molecular chaperone
MQMLNASEITTEQMVDSLYSRVCPACGGQKGDQKTLCFECYGHLRRPKQEALYRRVGSGYEAAVREAMGALGAEQWHDPS